MNFVMCTLSKNKQINKVSSTNKCTILKTVNVRFLLGLHNIYQTKSK